VEREKQPAAKKKTPAERQEDSSDIERAVYDGMQDLRAEKPAPAVKKKPQAPKK
jgi:hypothetical protein